MSKRNNGRRKEANYVCMGIYFKANILEKKILNNDKTAIAKEEMICHIK